jgi:hypothetical protein
VVWVNRPRNGVPYFGVIIAYRNDIKPPYLIIETNEEGKYQRGAAIWREAHEFIATTRKSKTPGRIYRKNEKLGGTEMRGCGCHCCEHQCGSEPEPEE